MQHYSFPVALLHYDTTTEITGELVVTIPKYKFTKTFELSMLPQDIKDSHLAEPRTTIDFSIHASETPFVIEFDYYINNDHSTCVIFEPQMNIEMTAYGKDINRQQINNVPVRVMNLKQNGQEISKEILGLSKQFNFRSWVNAHLKNLDNLKFRCYIDLRHHLRLEKNINML